MSLDQDAQHAIRQIGFSRCRSAFACIPITRLGWLSVLVNLAEGWQTVSDHLAIN
jgi:hypothetical protein